MSGGGEVEKWQKSALVHIRSWVWECAACRQGLTLLGFTSVNVCSVHQKNKIRYEGPTDKFVSFCFRVKSCPTLMEMIMRNGLFQTALCLVGISAPVNCQTNWKNSKVSPDDEKIIASTLNIEEERRRRWELLSIEKSSNGLISNWVHL